MKKSLIILLTSLYCLYNNAQNISVSNFRLLDSDLTANTAGTMEVDQNGETAALIKVVTTQTGFTFDGGVLGIVKTVQKPSEIWVYVPRGLKKITIAHPNIGILRDYYLNIPIEAARTYEMILVIDNKEARTNLYSPQNKNIIELESHAYDDSKEVGIKNLEYTGKKTRDGADYYGELKSGIPNGYGRAVYPNGNEYEGNYVDGKRQGYGIYTFFDGEKYEGEWFQDQQHGKGTYYFSNNNRYEGLWFRDYQHGHGIMYYFNGDKYDGEWKYDKRSGKGIYTFASGAYYKGEWLDDKKNGNGFFDWGDGSSYEGEWKDNKCSGYGVFKYANGNIYEGEWKDDKEHGKGKLTTKDSVFEGTFKNGSYKGK